MSNVSRGLNRPLTHEQEPIPADWYERIALPASGSFRLGRQLRYAGALVLGLFALNLYGQSVMDFEQCVLASAILVLCALPIWLWLAGVDSGPPFMVFFCLLYAVYYAIPMFFIDRSNSLLDVRVNDSSVTLALELILAALICVMAGYYGPQNRLIELFLPRLKLQWRSYRAVKFSGLLFTLAGLFFYTLFIAVKLPKGLGQAGMYCSDLTFIGVCVLFALQLMGRLDSATKLLLWGVIVPARILIGFGSGAAAQGLNLVVTLAVLYTTFRRSIPWKTLLVGLAAAMIMRPMMGQVRELTWSGGRMSEASPFSKAALVSRVITNLVQSGQLPYSAFIQFTLRRLACTLTFAEVLRDTPDHVPYWGGATFYPILFKPIPRLIWSDKPEEVSGQSFGHRYSLLDPADDSTSFNLPQVVELYANFGIIGVLLGMTLYGIAYKAVLRLFVHPEMGFGAMVILAYMMTALFDIESAVSLAVGAVMWSIPFVAIVHLFVESVEMTGSAVVSA